VRHRQAIWRLQAKTATFVFAYEAALPSSQGPALCVSTRARPLPWDPLGDVDVVLKLVAVHLVLPMPLLPPARLAKGELREEGEERNGNEREGAEVVYVVVVMVATVCEHRETRGHHHLGLEPRVRRRSEGRNRVRACKA